jgi:CHAT domain-containing protein
LKDRSLQQLLILGDPIGAEESLERSLRILEAYPETGSLGSALNALGWLRHLQGELILARSLYHRALEIWERLYGPDSHRVAVALNNIGWLEIDLGEFEDSRRHLERGLRIATEIHGAGSVATIVYQLNLAERALAVGDLETAERFARRSWEIEGSFLDPDRPGLEPSAHFLGIVLRERGKYQEARKLLSRVLVVRERGFDFRTHEVAENLIALADVMVDLRNCSRAVSMYREAISILEDLYGPEHPDTVSARLKMSECFARMGDWQDAFAYALQAELDSQEHTRTMLTGLSERVGLRYASARSSGLDQILSLLSERPEVEATRQAFDAVIRGRALVLDEMANRRRTLSFGTASGGARLVEDLLRARKRLAYLSVQGPGGEEPELVSRFRQSFEVALRERDQAERALAEANREFRLAQRRRSAGLDEVESALPRESGLLGFVRFERFAGDGGRRVATGEQEPRDSYLAFLQRAGTDDIELIGLGGAGEIDALVEQVRSQVVTEARVTLGSSGARERAYRQTAERLRQRIWDPIAPYTKDLERLFVVPDGALHLVSLAGLPGGSSAYLLESAPRFHYLSAERDLLLETVGAAGEGLLAMGNPDFDETVLFGELDPRAAEVIASLPSVDAGEESSYRGPRSACESFEAMRFEPLPASQREVEEVVGVLHVATHGFYVGKDCPVREFRDGRGKRQVRFADLESPLLRSGLAFAGANHRRSARADEDDGILTAEEVAAMDLLGVEWAVLSSCESGVGDVQTGEGVFGLRRAFTSAGARTLIMSLWPVDDEATRDWMRLLYRHRFTEGATTLDAAHEATLKLLQTRREAGLSTHPFYWAGFVAAGDWR